MRPLIQFDLTRDELPPLDGHDWTTETPYSADMAVSDLLVIRSGSIERFREAVKLAADMMSLANPDMDVFIGRLETDENGETRNVTVRAMDSWDAEGLMRPGEALDAPYDPADDIAEMKRISELVNELPAGVTIAHKGRYSTTYLVTNPEASLNTDPAKGWVLLRDIPDEAA